MNDEKVSIEQLGLWLQVHPRSARRYIKRYRTVIPGNGLTKEEAEHLIRARKLAATDKLEFEVALRQSLEITHDGISPPVRPTFESKNLGVESEELKAYLAAHERYYDAWEQRLKQQESELRGVQQTLATLNLKLEALTDDSLAAQLKVHNQVHGSLRYAKKQALTS